MKSMLIGVSSTILVAVIFVSSCSSYSKSGPETVTDEKQMVKEDNESAILPAAVSCSI